MMIRITVNVSEEIKQKLEKLAKVEGRTVVELVREAIVKLLRERGMLEYRSDKPE